ncbi:MAG: EamA family transporter [Motilibacteraceae bacterium]
MGDGLAFAALGLFACNAFIVRAASARLSQSHGFLVALAANIVVAGIAVLGEAALSGLRPVNREAVLLFMLAGVLSSYLGRRGYFRAVEKMGPSRAAAVQVCNPLFALAFAWLFLGETLPPVAVAALAVVVLGLVLINRVPRDVADGRMPGRLPLSVLGPALLASLCYGVGNVVRGAGVDDWQEPVMGGLLGAVTGFAVCLSLQGRVRHLARDLRAADPVGLWLWVLAGGVTIAGQVAVIAATVYIPVAVAVAISSALPILVIPISVLVLGNVERVTRHTVAGAALVVGGVVTLVMT